MSKTLKRSLPALLLGLCMLVAQMVAFSQSSPAAHAAGATITVSNGSISGSSGGTVSFAAGTTVTVAGSGFTANTLVTITFNAPGPNTSSAASISTVSRPGDNAPSISATAGGTNTVTVTARTDASGQFSGTTTGLTNPAASFTIPSNAVNGLYYVSAVDASSAAITAPSVAVTVTGSPVGGLTLSNSVAPIGGSVFVTSSSTAFTTGGTVHFYLADFTAGITATVQPANAAGPTATFSSVTIVPLQVLSCVSAVGGTASAGSVTGGGTSCPVVSATTPVTATTGFVAANVQLASPAGAASAILSNIYGDQMFSIIATTGAAPTPGTVSTSGLVTAGIRINHTLSSISVATNSVPLNGSVSVSGSNFGANSMVWIYFVPSTGAVLAHSPNTGTGASGPGFFSSASGGSSLLVTPTGVPANASGGFTASVSLPSAYLSALGNTSVTGYFLAEDFANAASYGNAGYFPGSVVPIPTPVAGGATTETAPGARLNFPAIAAVNFLAGLSTANTLFISPSVAAINGTVTVTGTLGINEPVLINLQSSGTSGSTQCPKQLIASTSTNSAGVFSATFTVPAVCATLNVSLAGTTETLTAAGQNSGQTLTGTFSVPATNVVIAAGAIANTVVITGTGLGANEPAIVQISLPNPFSGQPQVLFSTTGTTTISGTVVVNGTLPAVFQSGLYNLTVTGVNTGLTKTNLIQLPLASTGTGQLNCPTSVLPGQPFVLSGVGLAPSTSISVSIPFTYTGTVPSATIFSNATAGLTQSFTPGATAGFGTANATLTANATGAYSVTVALPLGISPSTTGYPLTLTAPVTTGGVAQIFTCNVAVGTSTATLTSSLSSGTVGITTTLTGAGFGPSEPVNISLVYTGTTALSGVVVPGTTQTVVVSSTGGFTTTYSIASTVNALVPGTYLIQAQGQNTKLTAYAPFTVTGAAGATTTSIFFPEGYTGTVAGGANADFTEILSILNTNNFTTTYTVNYFLENAGAASTTTTVSGTIGPNSVVQRSVNTDAGANKSVAAQVTSPAPLAAERIISRSIAGKALDSSSSEGQAVNLTATGPFTYYFASGEVQLTNEEYLTLLNPTATSTTATITIVPQVSISATTAPTVAPITQVVPPMSRVTVPIRKDLVASGLTKFGVVLTSNAAPLAAERVEYYGDGIGSGKYGATTKPAGTTAFRQYIFASNVGTFPSAGGNGAIGTGTDLSEIDIINPGAASAGSATVTVSFFDKSGAPINSQQVQVDGGTRETINVNDVVGTQGDVFSAVVTSDKSVYVEKPTFYGGDPNLGGTHAVAAPTGSPSGLTSAAFPYLDTTSASGAPLSQTVFLYNPGASAITVNAVYVGSGTATTAKAYTVAPNSITTVNVNADTATLPKGPIGGMFQLVSTSTTVGQSFVSALTTNTANFSSVLGDQGTNLIGQ